MFVIQGGCAFTVRADMLAVPESRGRLQMRTIKANIFNKTPFYPSFVLTAGHTESLSPRDRDEADRERMNKYLGGAPHRLCCSKERRENSFPAPANDPLLT